ncbi:MAG: PsiF family protein [Steroidobacteraceae bacterium]
MKITPAFVAVALLGCGAAFAADAPAAPAAATAKHVSLKACNKQADAKSLTGKERSAFVKDCRAGKSTAGN